MGGFWVQGLRTPFGGGEVVQQHQHTSGVRCSPSRSSARQHIGSCHPARLAATKHTEGTSLICLRMRKIRLSPSVPTVAAKPQCLDAWGHQRRAHSPCPYCAGSVGMRPSSLVLGEGSTGGDQGMSREPEPNACRQELILQLRVPSSTSSVALVCNTDKQRAVLIKTFVLSCISLE